MTSDAKVGLLLGLAFIFIIAFIINGLPNFKHQPDSNELTRNMARPQRQAPGIGTTARRANRDVITRIEPVARSLKSTELNVQPQPQPIAQTVRFETGLPKPAVVAEKLLKPTMAVQKTHPAKAARARIYTIKEGDSLAYIAKKFYGEEEGNRKVNIERIFRANRKILRKADQIYVGQKLIIPSLADIVAKSDGPTVALAPAKLKSVKSIGARRLKKPESKAGRTKYYVVEDGDSLWKIASEQLGNGSRYTEIARLNSKVLKNEDHLVVGMRLKLPWH